MPLRAFIVRCLLALALVANGLPAMASPALAEAEPGMAHMDCHGEESTADQAVPPTPAGGMDCCDGGDCACSCLHHAPVAMRVLARLATLRPPGPALAVLSRVAPAPLLPPSLRPPIA